MTYLFVLLQMKSYWKLNAYIKQEKSNCQVVVMKMNNSLEVYRTVALGSIRPNDNTHLHSFFNPEYDYADVTLTWWNEYMIMLMLLYHDEMNIWLWMIFFDNDYMSKGKLTNIHLVELMVKVVELRVGGSATYHKIDLILIKIIMIPI